MPVFLEQRRVGEVVVFDLAGKITSGEVANSLLESVNGLLTQDEKRIVFNFERVQYVDSAGLGILVKCRNAALARQAQLMLLKLPRSIQDLMRITKLDSLFQISDDEASAIASFK